MRRISPGSFWSFSPDFKEIMPFCDRLPNNSGTPPLASDDFATFVPRGLYHGKKSVKIKQVHNKENAQALIWRHNEHDSVSNHQPHGCLLSRLFRHKSKKTSKLRVTGLCVGNSPGPVNSPHKGPVTRKMFPFDDVIMSVSIPWLHDVVLMKPKATFLPHTLSHFLLSYSVQKCRKYCLTFSVVLVPMRAFKLFRSMG